MLHPSGKNFLDHYHTEATTGDSRKSISRLAAHLGMKRTIPPDIFADSGQETVHTVLVCQPFEVHRTAPAPLIAPPRPAVEWRRGQHARHKDRIVQIDSEVVGHADAPGEACYEVLACDEVRQRLERLCVRAAELEGR